MMLQSPARKWKLGAIPTGEQLIINKLISIQYEKVSIRSQGEREARR